MKRILLLLLLLLPIVALAQYPTFSNKQKLGVQTTGDGLIFRGTTINNIPNYTPSNVNNAYFHLDTTTSKLYLYSATAWQQVYPTASDTTSLGAYLLKSDTLAMLLPYLRKSDTISLSNRINNKLNATDTVSLSNRINLKLNKTDTINLSNRIDLKLNKSDTISLSNRIDIKLNASDTVSLSNRINTKLNSNDTINLSNRINKKLDTLYVNYQTNVDLLTNKDTINITTLEAGSGINITNNVISLDTTLLDSVVRVQNVYVKNGTGTTLNKGEAVYVTGANGTNIIVGRASNVSEASSSKTLGLTMTSIAIDGFGYVVKEGLLAGLNTSASDSAGVPIWLGVNGALIYGLTNKPYAPNHLVYLGVVTRKNPSVGEVYVTVQNGFEIKELHDVQIIEPVNKASLYYNSSQSLWRDTTAALLVSDTVSMLSKYVNTYSNQTGINGNKTFNNVVTIDSATITGKLLVNTNISDAVKINSNTNSTNLELMNSSGTVSIKSSNKNMILQTDTTALVYLNGDNKKVGILTMNPQQELEVNGNARITGLNNNLVPLRIVGSSNNNDLTNVNLGEGLSFANDTLKVDLTIIDTAIAASSITLTGHVTGTGSTNSTVPTIIGNGVVTNDMLAGNISDTKLNTITTAGKVSNTATTATNNNTVNTIVSRDGSGDFSARNITATNFYGLASTATLANTIQSTNTTGIIKLTTSSNSVLPIITVPDVNATMATTNLSQTFGGTQTFSNTISGSINGNASTATNVAYSGLTGVVPTWNQNTTGNAATVTSVLPSNFASQTANTVLAAPNGSNGTPTFRSLVSADIPSLNYLPLSGGILTGGLTGTTGTFTGQLNLNYSSGFTGGGIITDPGNISGIKLYDAGAGNMTIFNKSVSTSFGSIIFSTGNSSGLPSERMRITHEGNINITNNVTANSFIKSGGLSTQFLKADGSVDANTYLTSGTAAYLPLAGGTMTGTINRQEGANDGSANTFYYNILNYFARRDNVKGNATAQITFTDRPGTYNFPVNVRTSDIYLMTAKSFNGSQLGQYLDTTLSVVANQDGGRVGISKLNPAYKLDVNGTFNASGNSLIGGTLGVTGATTLSNLSGSGTRMVTASNTGVLSTTTIPTGTIDGSGTTNYLPKFTGTSTLGSSGLFRDVNRFSINEGTDQSFGWDFMGNTSNPFIGNNVKTSTTFERVERMASTTLFNPAAIIFGYQRVNNSSGATSPGGMNFMTTSGNLAGDINPITYSRMFIEPSGNIGIGTMQPSFKLDIQGTLGVTGATSLSSTLGVTGATTLNNILTINSGANTNSLNINNTGTSNILSMYSTNNNSFTRSEYKNGLTGNTTSDGLSVGYYDGGYFVNYENTKSYLYTNNNTNQLVLDTDGNVGVGIADATAKLDVSGTLKVSGTTTLSNLGTNGTRMVVTDNNGLLSTQAIPTVTQAYYQTNTFAIQGGNITFPAAWMTSYSSMYLNIDSPGAVFVELPAANQSTNKFISIKNITNGTVSSVNSSNQPVNNIQPLGGSTLSSVILTTGGGKWTTIFSDGTNWIKMSGN